MVGVEPYVLRFWETQFSFVRPKQSRSRHRNYTQGDVETLKIVKHLLHTEGFTIAGARKYVREKGLEALRNPMTAPSHPGAGRKTSELFDAASSNPNASVNLTPNGAHRALREIREDLRALHKLLITS
jgi:DNA-binding transcriptional MerR regulator